MARQRSGNRLKGAGAAALAVCGVLAAAAVIPTAALALFQRDYWGQITGDPTSEIDFNVVKTNSGKKVKRMIFNGLSYECESAPSGEVEDFMKVTGSFRVSHGEFSGRREVKPLTEIDPTARVKGEFSPGGVASGTIRVKGELAGPGSNCDTGTLDWTAAKPV